MAAGCIQRPPVPGRPGGDHVATAVRLPRRVPRRGGLALAGVGVAALAVLAGLLGWLVVRVLDGDLAVTGLGDRRADARRRR
ncbi:hypothetical protein NKG94_09945 [Micromonospora sp. M12]